MNSIASESDHISRKQMAELIDACAFAWKSGTPLSRYLTFNLKRLEMRPQLFISHFTKLTGDFFASHDVVRAYEWVLEKPPLKSLNCHMLIHVPQELLLSFSRMELRWASAAGLKIDQRTVDRQRVGDKPGPDPITNDADHLCNVETVLGYMLKGGEEEACDILRLDQRNQGVIRGKRIGVAEAIGRKARRLAGYSAPTSHSRILPFAYRNELGIS